MYEQDDIEFVFSSVLSEHTVVVFKNSEVYCSKCGHCGNNGQRRW